MNPRDQQLLDLAQSLLQQTISGRIPWQRTERIGRYLYVGETATVILQGPMGVLSRALVGNYSLTLVDGAGNTIDGIEVNANRELSISAAISSDTSKSQLVREAQPVLERLFQEVEQYMSNPSPVIEDLIREIGTK